MKCPYCANPDSKVIDSRSCDHGTRIRRRRECLRCKNRFTTFEAVETEPIIIVKKDKSRQFFDRNKLLTGMLRACKKRPVSPELLQNAIGEIEINLRHNGIKEISSEQLGEMTLEKLRHIDEIAYVRFASVYHDYKDIQSFSDELSRLISDDEGESGKR